MRWKPTGQPPPTGEMVAMLPGSEVLKGLEKSSLQGDSNITSLFTELEAPGSSTMGS